MTSAICNINWPPPPPEKEEECDGCGDVTFLDDGPLCPGCWQWIDEQRIYG